VLVEAVPLEEQLPLLALLLPVVVLHLALLLVLELPLLALLPLVAAVAVEELQLQRSFSAETVGRLTSGIPRYAPVPRSRRNPKRRP
jgi:hypothetical protein